MTDESPSFRRVRFAFPQGEMAGLAFGDPSRPPDVVFLHATGLNALTYKSILEPLSAKLHVLAVDLRGHGRSTLPASVWGYSSWTRHRNDVIDLIETHLRVPVTLAGHSMGGTTGLLAAGARPDLVLGLALLDPVLLSPARYASMRVPGAVQMSRWTTPIARAAARRRAAFETRENAFKALQGRGFFRTWSDETLRDYLEDGLTDADGGGLRLSCAPAYESATFAAQGHDPWRALMRANDPIVVLRAETGSTCPKGSADRIMALRPDARVAVVEGAGHAHPMERPDRTRAAIETVVLKTSPARRYRDLV